MATKHTFDLTDLSGRKLLFRGDDIDLDRLQEHPATGTAKAWTAVYRGKFTNVSFDAVESKAEILALIAAFTDAPAEPQLYPECEKLAKVAPQSQQLGAFIEWLGSTDRVIGVYGRDATFIRSVDIESLLAEYFNIDMKKVEAERRQMIAAIETKPQ